MDWLLKFQRVRAPQLADKEVDCRTCQVSPPLRRPDGYNPVTKCCQFSPFLSCFALGAHIHQGGDLTFLEQEHLVCTPLGVVHSHEHRSQQDSLCHFFRDETKDCAVWKNRPATCYTFFCISRKQDRLKKWESQLLEDETELLSDWFDHMELPEDLWQEWGDSMDERPKVPIPQAMIISDVEKAKSLYLSSYKWLNKL